MLIINQSKTQKGVGLIEILVALILLALAVLGYVALQTKSIAASQESIVKTQAQSVIKGLAENIRANNTARNSYVSNINNYLNSTTAPKNCDSESCNSTQLANYDAFKAMQYAKSFGLSLGMAECPGMVEGSSFARQCIFAAWGNTTLTQSSGELNYSDCLNSTTGVYVSNSSCLMMELY